MSTTDLSMTQSLSNSSSNLPKKTSELPIALPVAETLSISHDDEDNSSEMPSLELDSSDVQMSSYSSNSSSSSNNSNGSGSSSSSMNRSGHSTSMNSNHSNVMDTTETKIKVEQRDVGSSDEDIASLKTALTVGDVNALKQLLIKDTYILQNVALPNDEPLLIWFLKNPPPKKFQEITEILITEKTLLFTRTQEGMTPLVFAIQHELNDVINQIVKIHPQILLQKCNGKYPYELAEKSNSSLAFITSNMMREHTQTLYNELLAQRKKELEDLMKPLNNQPCPNCGTPQCQINCGHIASQLDALMRSKYYGRELPTHPSPHGLGPIKIGMNLGTKKCIFKTTEPTLNAQVSHSADEGARVIRTENKERSERVVIEISEDAQPPIHYQFQVLKEEQVIGQLQAQPRRPDGTAQGIMIYGKKNAQGVLFYHAANYVVGNIFGDNIVFILDGQRNPSHPLFISTECPKGWDGYTIVPTDGPVALATTLVDLCANGRLTLDIILYSTVQELDRVVTQNPATLNLYGSDGETALTYLIKNASNLNMDRKVVLEKVQLLAAKKPALLTAKENNVNSHFPLIVAIHYDMSELFTFILINAPTSTKLQFSGDQTALMKAALGLKSVYVFQILYIDPDSIFVRSTQGKTVLDYANQPLQFNCSTEIRPAVVDNILNSKSQLCSGLEQFYQSRQQHLAEVARTTKQAISDTINQKFSELKALQELERLQLQKVQEVQNMSRAPSASTQWNAVRRASSSGASSNSSESTSLLVYPLTYQPQNGPSPYSNQSQNAQQLHPSSSLSASARVSINVPRISPSTNNNRGNNNSVNNASHPSNSNNNSSPANSRSLSGNSVHHSNSPSVNPFQQSQQSRSSVNSSAHVPNPSRSSAQSRNASPSNNSNSSSNSNNSSHSSLTIPFQFSTQLQGPYLSPLLQLFPQYLQQSQQSQASLVVPVVRKRKASVLDGGTAQNPAMINQFQPIFTLSNQSSGSSVQNAQNQSTSSAQTFPMDLSTSESTQNSDASHSSPGSFSPDAAQLMSNLNIGGFANDNDNNPFRAEGTPSFAKKHRYK